MGVAACLLLEYGVSTAAVAVGWSGYVNEALVNITGLSRCRGRSWPHRSGCRARTGIINLPAVILVGLCMLLLIRGASESAKVNAVMVVIKLTVLVMFSIIAFTAFDADHFADFAPFGAAGVGAAAGTIFFSFIGLDAVSTAGDEVKDPQKTMPRALIGALFIVIGIYLLVSISAIGAQPWTDFEGQSEAGLSKILEIITGNTIWATILALGAVISIFSVTLVTMYGQHPGLGRRCAAETSIDVRASAGAIGSSASARSATLAMRSSRDFARQRATTSSRIGGASGADASSDGAGDDAISAQSPCIVSACQTGLPVTSS